MLFLQIAILILGFVFLIKGADFFVDSASAIARIFHIPSVIIGLTIVSFGTSLPELAVSVTSAIKGVEGIAIGNVVGSNIVNLMLVAGVTALIIPVEIEKKLLTKDFPFSILCAALLLLIISDIRFAGASKNVITRADALILLMFFAVYMYSVVHSTLSEKSTETRDDENDSESTEKSSTIKSVLFLIIGLAGIIAGGQMTIKSATWIAHFAGMSDRLIGLTIIAFGTSLPELITSIVAASKGENDIAMGNVVGSNIFNILFILGTATVIRPLEVSGGSFIDIAVLIFCSIVVCLLALPKKKLTRLSGLVMTALYISYTLYIFM